MRGIGLMHPTDGIPVPADQVTTFIMTGGSSAQAQDWLSSGATASPNAGTAGIHIVRITGQSTAGAPFGVFANLMSTGAAIPTSGTSIASSGVNHPVNVPTYFQIPGNSTGFSIAAFSSGYVSIEQWRKA